MRGITIGPIENTRHPNRGYGSPAYRRGLYEARSMGATWVSLTPFGRVQNLQPSGVDWQFELPVAENQKAVEAAIEQAHAAGLKVLLVPHLWVESGEWRALIDPKSPEGWAAYAKSYQAFVLMWAKIAARVKVDLLSIGVEQRLWVTGEYAYLYSDVISEVRKVYPGPITYSANWDDVNETAILQDLDVIGINAFYPLAQKEGASFSKLLAGGKAIASKVHALAEKWHKPVIFTEIGYTARKDPAVKPWEWPDSMKDVQISGPDQAKAYAALLAPLLDEPAFGGFFVWRLYADPDDISQEAEWGFSPRGRGAELVMRDAFSARWASDPWPYRRSPFSKPRARKAWLVDGPLRPWWQR